MEKYVFLRSFFYLREEWQPPNKYGFGLEGIPLLLPTLSERTMRSNWSKNFWLISGSTKIIWKYWIKGLGLVAISTTEKNNFNYFASLPSVNEHHFVTFERAKRTKLKWLYFDCMVVELFRGSLASLGPFSFFDLIKWYN